MFDLIPMQLNYNTEWWVVSAWKTSADSLSPLEETKEIFYAKVGENEWINPEEWDFY